MNSCLNRAYRLIWSELHCAWVAVAETVRGRGKASGRSARVQSAAFAVGLLGSSVALAQLPTGGQIVGGAGSISSTGTTMTVTQTTDRMAADWQSFSIGKGHTVNFVQPNSNSVALNRVLGSDVSVIQGALTANGKLFLINPNGILFTPDAHVNVGAMVASTLNITTENFMAGNYRFEGASSNAIVNRGNITAHGDGTAGGTVALIAAKIVNEGSITAHKGNVLMGAGSRVTLNLGGPVSIQVEQGALDALIEQGGAIKADGGLVYLTAKAANDIVTTVINHTGITEAQTLATGERGEIYLMGDMEKGRVQVAGTLDASAPNGGDGGFVETSAARVAFAEGLSITTEAPNGKTGQWLIDPVDFTVAASGGDITGSALGVLLGSNSVTIQTITGTDSVTEQFGVSGTNGDIFVNDSVTWTSGTTLSLNAHRNIEINASIDASGGDGGKLSLLYGQGAVASGNTATYTINAPVLLKNSGAYDGNNVSTQTNFSTKLGNHGSVINYTVLSSQFDLQNMTATGNYALGSSLTFSAPVDGSNWTPIINFSGRLEGLGNTISGLTHTGPGSIGLFGTTASSGARRFSNLKILNFALTHEGGDSGSAGALLGNGTGDFYNISLSGVTISDLTTADKNFVATGGMIGRSTGTGLKVNRITGDQITIAGFTNLGGLIGLSQGSSASISNVQFGSVTISTKGSFSGVLTYAGGILGRFQGSSSQLSESGVSALTITNQTGTISNGAIGGIVGGVEGGVSLSKSYAAGSITVTNLAHSSVGGFAGLSYGAQIADSYSLVNIVANSGGSSDSLNGAGGFLGNNSSTTTISNSYAIGSVSGTHTVKGGFLGRSAASGSLTLLNNFWDSQTSLQSSGVGSTTGTLDIGVGKLLAKTSALMKTASTFSAWDGSIWQYQDPGQRLQGYGVGVTYPFLRHLSTTDGIRGDYSAIFGGGWGGLNSWQQPGADGSAYVVTNEAQLQNINQVAAGGYSFALSSDINLSSVSNWLPIGNSTTRFNGSFDGGGFTVSSLTIDRPTSDNVGLFGFTSGATIRHLAVVGANVIGQQRTGIVVGYALRTALDKVSSAGSVNGSTSNDYTQVGGVVGYLSDSTLSKSYSTASVSGAHGSVGGLVGYSTGTGAGDSSITDSYATGSVTSSGNKEFVGGLVGGVLNTNVTRSYAIGQVSSGASRWVGGLVGGDNGGTNIIVDSFWDLSTSGKSLSVGGDGKTTAEMNALTLYEGADWDIEEDAIFSGTYFYPRLRFTGSGTIWQIKSAPRLTSGDDQKTAAIKAVQDGVRNVVRQSALDRGLGRGLETVSRPTEQAQQQTSLSGGLAFVQVDQPGVESGSGGSSASGADSIPSGASGRDPSGFMRVFVVRGGVNLPPQASDTAQENTRSNQGGAQ